MTTTSYPTTGFQTTSPSTFYQQQRHVTNYGYGDESYYYPTTTTAAATTTAIGHSGSMQNASSRNQQTAPSPPSFSYPSSSIQSQPHSQQASSYGTVPISDSRLPSLVAEPRARVHASGSAMNDGKHVDGEAQDVGTIKKDKRRWSLYGRSRNETHVATETTGGGGSSNHKHVPAKRRWSLHGRSKKEANYEAETDSVKSASNIAVSKSGSISAESDDKNSSQKNHLRAPRRWSFYGSSKKQESNETKPASESTSPAIATDPTDQLVVYQLRKEADRDDQKQVHEDSDFQPAEVHPDRQLMKQDRKAKMAGAATTGAFLGAALSGPAWPVGMVAGAAIGSYTSKVTARAWERRKQREWEKDTFNAYIAKGEAGVQREGVAFA
eukprot:CAMPEP_0197184214 /NCGR_PEP_ID=MMETSP1423-20130617/9471_1 /TAXON_ID=476441 /ORGANISM="Pseudo-nitzschia heimii, Strain UNC1101" /LENGTH=381 /DNA_ID=CAMNT_0042634983 /DNA_START=48 /DNA_END=1193 /DNA_ORIENTATION=+